VALAQARGGQSVAWIVELAVTLFDGGVLLDRMEPLCSEAISLLNDPEAIIEVDLAPSPGHTAVNRQRLVNQHAQALLLLARFYEKQGNRDKAHLMLWQASDYFSARAPAAGETNTELLRTHSLGRYRVLRERAEMAEREGRKLDALNGYREALAAFPINRLELGDRQHKLWKELGGTEEGWQQWTNLIVPEKNEKPTPLNHEGSAEKRKLPPLVARDIEGNQWTLDRFAGKTVVAVVWATWCEPCRAELPYFAKLTDRIKERSDLLAISFNTDDNVAVAQAFAKSLGYSFPILAAKQYAQDLMPTLAIPCTWIIRDGTIVKEYYGFGPDGDKWIEQILADLSK
jgi:thiol-disulfide isomerase/thioredoxin